MSYDIVMESDQFSNEEFIPFLGERMNVLNPYVRQFLVGWITVLDSVHQADSELSEFLQEIKNSPRAIIFLKSVDYGRMAEILVQRAAAPDEFTLWTTITWVSLKISYQFIFVFDLIVEIYYVIFGVICLYVC
ncbi:putative vacuole morphology and inheritance protein [Helianthus anomalus]